MLFSLEIRASESCASRRDKQIPITAAVRTASFLSMGPFIPSQEPPYGGPKPPNQCKKKPSQKTRPNHAQIYLLSSLKSSQTRLEINIFRQTASSLATFLRDFLSTGAALRHFSPRTNVRHHHAWTWTHTTTVGAHTTRFENNKRRQKNTHQESDQVMTSCSSLKNNTTSNYQNNKPIDSSSVVRRQQKTKN